MCKFQVKLQSFQCWVPQDDNSWWPELAVGSVTSALGPGWLKIFKPRCHSKAEMCARRGRRILGVRPQAPFCRQTLTFCKVTHLYLPFFCQSHTVFWGSNHLLCPEMLPLHPTYWMLPALTTSQSNQRASAMTLTVEHPTKVWVDFTSFVYVTLLNSSFISKWN